MGEVFRILADLQVLPIARSTYHAHVAKRVDPGRLSSRAKRDLSLKVQIRRVFAENFEAYGVRKVWRQLRREGASVPSHGGEAVGIKSGGKVYH